MKKKTVMGKGQIFQAAPRWLRVLSDASTQIIATVTALLMGLGVSDHTMAIVLVCATFFKSALGILKLFMGTTETFEPEKP